MTAMQEAINHFMDIGRITLSPSQVAYILKQFLPKEREQIVEARMTGDETCSTNNANQYYSSKYGEK